MQVAGLKLIITGKPLTLKVVNNPYTHQGFLHNVVGVFHIVNMVKTVANSPFGKYFPTFVIVFIVDAHKETKFSSYFR